MIDCFAGAFSYIVCLSSLVFFAVCFLFAKLAPKQESVCSPVRKVTPWPNLKESLYMGDDIGDAFLEEVGISAIYQAESVLDLAKCSGPRGDAFLKQFTEIPVWLNASLIEVGAAFQRRWSEIFFLGALGTIIESYGYANGAQILMETGRLSCPYDSTKRLLETALFNLDIMEYGVGPLSPALETIARVRVLHCIVRKHMKTTCPWWKLESHGTPVSQLDGLHTIFLNSHSSMRAMKLQGLLITKEEENAVSMLWAYVGYLLGIDEKFLPRCYEDEQAHCECLFQKEYAPDVNSFKLTKATIASVIGLPPLYLSERVLHCLLRLTMGPFIADSLGIEKRCGLQEHIIIHSIRFTNFCKWLLFCITSRRFSRVSILRHIVLSQLEKMGVKNYKWRFVLTRKKQTNNK
jgi:hypothetical protein